MKLLNPIWMKRLRCWVISQRLSDAVSASIGGSCTETSPSIHILVAVIVTICGDHLMARQMK